jgi:tetratricopeptide (TPR) repeat protein
MNAIGVIRRKTFTWILLVSAPGFLSLQAQTEKAVAAFSRSLEKEKLQDYFGAIKCIQDLNDSTSYESNLRLGWLFYKAGQEKKSRTCYQNAIRFRPAAIEPRIGFGYPAYLLEDNVELIAQDRKILEIDPNNKATNGNLGLIYYYDKEYAKALPYFQKVVQMYPFDYDNNLSLAWTYFYLGKNAEAEKHFNVVLFYSPTDASAKEGLSTLKKQAQDTNLIRAFARSYEFSGASNYKAAIEVLKANYDKSSYFTNLRLGWLHYLAGKQNEAAAFYKIATELNASSVEAKLGYALPLEAMGNKNELKTLYESVLTLDPQNTVINYKLGNLYYEKKEYETALKYFEKVTKLYPFNYDGLLMHAWTLYYTDKYADSRAAFYKILCLSPGDRSAMYALTLKPLEEQRRLENKEIIKPR